jgi:hypothetical protein
MSRYIAAGFQAVCAEKAKAKPRAK